MISSFVIPVDSLFEFRISFMSSAEQLFNLSSSNDLSNNSSTILFFKTFSLSKLRVGSKSRIQHKSSR